MKFPSLLPRNGRFDVLLKAMSDKAHESALQLKIYAESKGADEAARAGDAIKRCKVEAKALSIDVTRELSGSFITPFDREDIQDFASHLYKIPKLIEKIHDRLEMHGMKEQRGDFSEQIDLIVEEGETLRDMVEALLGKRNDKIIKEKVAVLHNLEQRGDDILGALLVRLFREKKDARDLILHKDIYDMLEKVVDRFRDVASVTLQIVLKYS